MRISWRERLSSKSAAKLFSSPAGEVDWVEVWDNMNQLSDENG
jgi:hypothetical protein